MPVEEQQPVSLTAADVEMAPRQPKGKAPVSLSAADVEMDSSNDDGSNGPPDGYYYSNDISVKPHGRVLRSKDGENWEPDPTNGGYPIQPPMSRAESDREISKMRDPLGPGSLGYTPPQPSVSSQVPIHADVPRDPNTAYPGMYRQRTPTGDARSVSGQPVAPPAGPAEPTDGVWTNPRTGYKTRLPAVPEATMPMWDPARIVTTGPERTAGAVTAIKDNFSSAMVPPMGKNGGEVTPEQRAENAKAGRNLNEAGAELLGGVGDMSMPLIAASAAAAPGRTIAGLLAGFGASEGAGAAVHGHVTPEEESLIRAVSMFAPSAFGVLSGLKSGTIETPQGKFSAASVFGGRARAGVGVTPDTFTGRVKVGGVQAEVNIPRGGRGPAPAAPDVLDEGTQAMVAYERAHGNIPTPPPPVAPVSEGKQFGHILSGEQVDAIAQAIAATPAEQRGAFISETHDRIAQWIGENGGKVVINGRVHLAKTPDDAQRVAAQVINQGVADHDARLKSAAKVSAAASNLSATRPTMAGPVSGKPPESKHLTTDTAAVQNVAETADLHPAQVPAIFSKQEPAREAAALAKPPAPVDPREASQVGATDKESGRKIFQPSDDAMQNERLAGDAAPELATKLSHISASVPGVTFDRVRPQKGLERVESKVDEAGKPAETVPDYLSAQIAVDSPEAKDHLLAELHKNFKVLDVEDSFLQGRPDLGGYPSANVQVQLSNHSSAEIQLVPREVQEITNRSHTFYVKGRDAELAGDHAGKEKHFAESSRLNGEALARFKERNGIASAPVELSAGDVHIEPAHASAVEALREGIRGLPRGVKMPYGGESVDFGSDNPTDQELKYWLWLLIEHHVDGGKGPFPEHVSQKILGAVDPQHIESVRRDRWSRRTPEDVSTEVAPTYEDLEKYASAAAGHMTELQYKRLGWSDVLPYREAKGRGVSGEGLAFSSADDSAWPETAKLQRVRDRALKTLDAYKAQLRAKYGDERGPDVPEVHAKRLDELSSRFVAASQAVRVPTTKAAKLEQVARRMVEVAVSGRSRVVNKPGMPPAVVGNGAVRRFMEAHLDIWHGLGGVNIGSGQAHELVASLRAMVPVSQLAYQRVKHLLPTSPAGADRFRQDYNESLNQVSHGIGSSDALQVLAQHIEDNIHPTAGLNLVFDDGDWSSDRPGFLNTYREESAHSIQRELGGGQLASHVDLTSVASHPVARKAAAALGRFDVYDPENQSTVAVEVSAKIIAGSGSEQLGLSADEQAEFIDHYFRAVADEVGVDSLDKFAGVATEPIVKIIEGVKNDISKNTSEPRRARSASAAAGSQSGTGLAFSAGGPEETSPGGDAERLSRSEAGRGKSQRPGNSESSGLDESAGPGKTLERRVQSSENQSNTTGRGNGKEVSGIKPGAKSAGSGNETGRSDIEQLTEAIRRNSASRSLMDRIRAGASAGVASVRPGDALSTSIAKLKGTYAALADALVHPPKFGDYEKATGEWSGADVRSALFLNDFTKAIKEAVPSKLRREAISNWIEAGGDKAVLRERADKSGPKYKPGYEAALTLTDHEQTIARNVMSLHEASGQEALKAGIIQHAVTLYVQHLYKESPAMVRKVMARANFASLQTNPKFAKERVIPTYFEAEQMGLTPKDKDVGYLTAVHERALREALASRSYIHALLEGKADDGRLLAITSWASSKQIGDPHDRGYLIKPNLPPGEEYLDYQSIDHPALRNWKWSGDIEGRQVYVMGDVLVHPSIYQKVKNNLSTSALRNYEVTVLGHTVRPGNAALRVVGEIKNFVLSFSLFHQVTLGVHGLEHRVNLMKLPELDLSDKHQAGLVDHGLMVAHYDAMEAFGEGVVGGGLVTKIPLAGPGYRWYSDYLFKSFLPRLKMQMALEAFERNSKRFPDLSKDQLYSLTASQANAAFGGLNYKMLARNKTFQDALRLFVLAPDFTEARGRFVAQAVTKYGREQLVALLLGGAVLYTLGRILNQLLDGKPHWDKPFTVVHKGREFELRTIQGDVVSFAKDPAKFLQNRVAPPVSLAVRSDGAARGHETTTQKLKRLGSNFAPIPARPWLRDSSDTNAQKALDSFLRTIGVNERKEQKDYTPAEELMHQILRDKMPPMTPEKRKALEAEHARIAAGDASPAERHRAFKESQMTELERGMRSMTFSEARRVYEVASPEEKKIIEPLLHKKRINLIRRNPREAEMEGAADE